MNSTRIIKIALERYAIATVLSKCKMIFQLAVEFQHCQGKQK